MESLLGSDVAAKKPKGGLYTLQFSYVPPTDEFEELRVLYEQRTRTVRAIRQRMQANRQAAAAAAATTPTISDGNVPDLEDEDMRVGPHETKEPVASSGNNADAGSGTAATATKSARDRFMERVAHELCAEGEDTVPGEIEDESARKRKKVEKSHPSSPQAAAATSPVLDPLADPLPPQSEEPAVAVSSGPEDLERAEVALKEVQDEWSRMESRCATEFHPWTLLCRLRFEGDSMGRIKGSVKVKQPLASSSSSSGAAVGATASPAASMASSGAGGNSNGGGSRCTIQRGSLWKPSDEVKLVISVDRLDGSIVGRTSDIANATIRCEGHVSNGSYVGRATVLLPQEQPIRLSRKLRFSLKEYKGLRCSWCLDPIDELHACTGCLTSLYCSTQCQSSHASVHAPICQYLKPFADNTTAGKAPTTFAGADFFVYWRNAKGLSYELIVDGNNPLGRAYKLHVNTVKDAREGLTYSFFPAPDSTASSSSSPAVAGADGLVAELPPPSSSSSTNPNGIPSPITEEALNEMNINVFFAVAQNALDEGALMLASTCLNHLFVFCDNVDHLALEFFQFYDLCVRDMYEGSRPISCLGEYVMLVRTTYELGQLLLEWALKAPFAALFWQRLVSAKDVLVSLYNLNSSLVFAPAIQNVREILTHDQQRQTLHLLAKIFVVMASRADKDLSQRLIRRAEECYRDSIDDDTAVKNRKEVCSTFFKLAALCSLSTDPEDQAKAKEYKAKGLMEVVELKRQEQRMLSDFLAVNGGNQHQSPPSDANGK